MGDGEEKPIEVLTFVAEIECENNDRKCESDFTVIKGTGKTLLGRRTTEKVDVLRVGPLEHTYSVTEEATGANIRRKFADVFAGVGKLKNYQLKLHVDKAVQPIAQPVRRLPFGLREKVEKKLDELLEKEITEEVSNAPTTWLSPLVVVPKPDGDIRICVDMRRANEAIVIERHPIPTIEEVLQDLSGSTVFSKLDLKWGFHQAELAEESREITD